MKLLKIARSGLLILFFIGSVKLFAQDNCALEVSYKLKNADRGRRNGSVTLTITNDDKSRYKVFMVDDNKEKSQRELSNRTLDDLRPDTYRFLVIDTREKCVKELFIKVKENAAN